MSARISQRKEKVRLAVSLSTKDLLKELASAKPKFKSKIRKELEKRGVDVNAVTEAA